MGNKNNKITQEDLQNPYYFPYAFLNIKYHPKQREVVLHPAKDKVICTGRRTGKTVMVACEAIRGASFNIYPKQFICAPIYKQTRIVFDKIVDLLQRNKLQKDIQRVVSHPYPHIKLVNGAELDFGSTDNPNSMRGEGYHRAFLDEANFIKDKAKDSIRPMLFDTGGPIWQTSTPWNKNHFHDDYQKGLKLMNNEMASFHFTSFDNPYLNKETVQKEIEKFGKDSVYVQTEIYGNFVEEVDKFFPVELIDRSITEYMMIKAVV